MEKLLKTRAEVAWDLWLSRAKKFDAVVEVPDWKIIDNWLFNGCSMSATWLFHPDGRVTFKTPTYEVVNCKIVDTNGKNALRIVGELSD